MGLEPYLRLCPGYPGAEGTWRQQPLPCGIPWQNLRAELKAHQGRVLQVLGSGRSLAASGHPQAQRVAQQCQELEGRWAELEQACEAQARGLQQAVALQQVGLREHRVRERVKVRQAP